MADPPKAEKDSPGAGQTRPKAGKTPQPPEEGSTPGPGSAAYAPRRYPRRKRGKSSILTFSDLHPFKDHPFGVRDDAEMKSLVESVRNGGVSQPALVRPREGRRLAEEVVVVALVFPAVVPIGIP